MTVRIVLAAVLAAALLAAPARAADVTYGSALTLPADQTDSHAEDWTAWPTATTPASAGGYAVTQAGEVREVAFRGSILAPSGIPAGFVFRVVVLRPQADGAVKLLVAGADLTSRLVGIDPQAVTTVDLQAFPERMCALPGDVVALATSGGYDPQTYPAGVPVQMFSRAPTSSYSVYKKAAGGPSFQVGTLATPTTAPDKELLMRVTVGTGDDARPTCRVATTPTPTPTPSPTPTAPPASGPVTLPAPASSPRVKRGKVRVGLTCPGPLACSGTVSLSNRSKAYGKARFALAAGAKGSVAVRLTKAAKRGLKAGHGKVTVKALAVTAAGDKASVRFRIRQ